MQENIEEHGNNYIVYGWGLITSPPPPIGFGKGGAWGFIVKGSGLAGSE